jgi:hypothetical protein
LRSTHRSQEIPPRQRARVVALDHRTQVKICVRWYETARNELGLDHNETRSWHGWRRHVSLVMSRSSCLARHARLRHGGDDPRAPRHVRRVAPKKTATHVDDDASAIPVDAGLIRWSMQRIRRIATRLARRRIRPQHIIAWPLWRRAHQAHAKRAHLKSQP